jgi:tetratricopeptide (TPR) repeat protein
MRGALWILLAGALLAAAQADPAALFGRAEQLRTDPRTRRQAADLYREAAAAFQAAGDASREARSRFRLGQMLELLADYAAARQAFSESLAAAARAASPAAEADAYYGLGRVAAAARDSAAALDYYREALARRRSLNQPFETALTLHNLATVHSARAEIPAALEAFAEALRIRREIQDQPGIGYTLYATAVAHWTAGDVPAALAAYREALTQWQLLKDLRGQADALNAMGLAFAALGDHRQARLRYGEALALFEKLGVALNAAYVRNNLGLSAAAEGNAAEARRLFHAALPALRAAGDELGAAYALHNLADLDHPATPATLEQLNEARAIKERLGDRAGANISLRRLAEAQRSLGRTAPALASIQEAIRFERAQGNRPGEAAAERIHAAILRDLRRLPEARDALERAATRIEDLRAAVVSPGLRGSYFATQAGLFEDLISVHLALGRPDLAFSASEQSRARVLLDHLSAARETAPRGAREKALAGEINSQAALLARMPAGSREEAAARRRVDLLFEEWSRLHGERRGAPGASAAWTPARVGALLLDAGTALVEYAAGERSSVAFVVTRGGFRHCLLPGRPVLVQRIRAWQDAVSGRSAGAGEAAAELRRLLIDPLGPLPGIRRIAFVPDAPLPFATLGALVIDRFEAVELPSAAALAALRSRRGAAGGPRLTLLADPVFSAADSRVASTRGDDPNPGWARLRFSGLEADLVARLFAPGEARRADGVEASRAFLDAPETARSRIVHLATHATVDEVRPELSAIVLAQFDGQGRPAPGFLRLFEIYDWKLAAELVVLSACRTASGAEVRGEGILSLTRGFLHAGAARVLASQWAVEDRATAQLMQRFYEGMLHRRLPPAAALRAAQLALRADPRWQDPYFWAGFSLYGEWR